MLFRGSSYEMPKVKKNYLLVNLYLSIVIQKKKDRSTRLFSNYKRLIVKFRFIDLL